MVTPATIGWNIVSSSWRPRKYHGAFDGFGVWLTLASSSSGAFTTIENTSRNARAGEQGDELDDQQVGPDVDLVDRRRLHVLDRAGLDDGEQPLGVPAGPAASGGPAAAVATAPCRRRGAVATAVAAPPPPASAPAARRRRRPWPAPTSSARAGGPGSGFRPRCRRPAAARRSRLAGGSRARGRARPRRPCPPRPSCAPPRPACAGAPGSRSSQLTPITADLRCRRPCGHARSGSP